MILERLSADVLGKVLQKMKPSKEALILQQLRECVADGCLDRKEARLWASTACVSFRPA